MERDELERDEAVIAKYAPTLVRLADAAIVAVRALMAAERAALKEMAGAEVEDWYTTLFGDPDCVLVDVERTLVIMKLNAEDAALRGAPPEAP